LDGFLRTALGRESRSRWYLPPASLSMAGLDPRPESLHAAVRGSEHIELQTVGFLHILREGHVHTAAEEPTQDGERVHHECGSSSKF
jgi:hypothetical protein